MPMKALLAFALAIASSLIALPREAEAGKPKSPFWAVVNADGTIVRSNGAIQAFVYPSPGYVHVDFDRDVSNCAFVATTTGGFAGQTGVTVDAYRLWVVTTDSAGSVSPLPFHVIVTCAK